MRPSEVCAIGGCLVGLMVASALPAGPNKGGNVRLINVRLKARVLFPEMNNQAAWRVLAKMLKHSSKHSNETVEKKGLAWHVISNHRTLILNIQLLEMNETSNMSELDK